MSVQNNHEEINRRKGHLKGKLADYRRKWLGLIRKMRLFGWTS